MIRYQKSIFKNSLLSIILCNFVFYLTVLTRFSHILLKVRDKIKYPFSGPVSIVVSVVQHHAKSEVCFRFGQFNI